jgi:arylsulfatase A-like enzyme
LDLAPTILDLFGITPPSSFEGKSLVREMYGNAPEEREILMDLPMTSDNARRRALIHGKSKLICFDGDTYCKLYDLGLDPGEQSPILSGVEHSAMTAHYAERAESVREIEPYACRADCLNGAYRKKDAEN